MKLDKQTEPRKEKPLNKFQIMSVIARELGLTK